MRAPAPTTWATGNPHPRRFVVVVEMLERSGWWVAHAHARGVERRSSPQRHRRDAADQAMQLVHASLLGEGGDERTHKRGEGMKATIGRSAAAVLGLDSRGVDAEMGLRVVRSTRRTLTLEGTSERMQSLAREFAERGDARGEGWDLSSNERAACRRAAKAIRRYVR